MVKKLNIFDSISSIFDHPVRIYEGPIHRIYADDFNLARGRAVYKKKDVIDKKVANFYMVDGKGYDFENIEHACILNTRDEAIAWCDEVVKNREQTIRSVLNGQITDPKEAHRLLDDIKSDSSCIYYIHNELKYSHTISKKELDKELAAIKKRNNRSEQDPKVLKK